MDSPVWVASDDEYNRAEPRRAAYIGRVYHERDFVPSDVHLERVSLADLAVARDLSPAADAMAALEAARAAWTRVHQQMSLEL